MTQMDHYCRICGKHEAGNWAPDCAQRLQETGLCFTCDFWQPKIRAAENGDDRCVRIDGVHYWIGEEESRSRFRGFAGNKFTIRFHDGTEVTTTNLWTQGKIPERFRSQLPDNADFVGHVNFQQGE